MLSLALQLNVYISVSFTAFSIPNGETNYPGLGLGDDGGDFLTTLRTRMTPTMLSCQPEEVNRRVLPAFNVEKVIKNLSDLAPWE